MWFDTGRNIHGIANGQFCLPGIMIKLAIIVVTPFPFVAYAFCSRMLYEFTQHSLDADELRYYFSIKHMLFGALKYYDETRDLGSTGDLSFYKKMINATIRLS